ncbi:MAG: CDP-glycerol glycerophosphotransferase family protein [Planctomycetota bacterium]|jgi:hypothetical protein
MEQAARRILFTGYAPIHFLCFLPVYQRLANDPRVELWLSGGFRKVSGDSTTFTLDGFYDPFPVDRSRVIPIERAREEDFDVLVCAHLSDSLFPRFAKRTVQIYHGVSFKNLAVRDKALRFEFLCLPGRYHAEMYQKHGLVRKYGSRCLVTGFPKADPLAGGSFERDALLRRAGVDPALPTILFAPTGDKHNSLETMGKEVIGAVGAAGAWNLLVKPHDHPKNDINWFDELAPLQNDRFRLVRDLNVVPYLQAADLLITDASSVAVEFTLLDRPILFLEVPKLFKKVAKRAAALVLMTYGRKIGRIVEEPGRVVSAIADSLAHPDREGRMRRAMARHVFHDPGGASERVAGVVRHAADLEEDLPEDVVALEPEGTPQSVLC